MSSNEPAPKKSRKRGSPSKGTRVADAISAVTRAQCSMLMAVGDVSARARELSLLVEGLVEEVGDGEAEQA